MTEIILKQMAETDTSTVSALWHGDKMLCFIAEDGFHEEKIPGITRIPAGKYLLKKRQFGDFYERYKMKFKHDFVIEISDVPKYRDILFHIGNFPKDTRGCLLTCEGVSYNQSENFFWGTGSEVAYKRFFGAVSKLMDLHDKVYLIVQR